MTDYDRGLCAARKAVQGEMRRKASACYTPREQHLMRECLEHAVEAIEMLRPRAAIKPLPRTEYRGAKIPIQRKGDAA